MIALKLDGFQINSRCRFIEHFTPAHIILRRAEFSSFANAHLRLRLIDHYHTKLFQAASELLTSRNTPNGKFRSDYWDNPFITHEMLDHMADKCLKEYQSAECEPAEASQVAVILAKMDLTGSERQLLYYMLTAAYMLAGIMPAYHPVTAEEIRMALDGEMPRLKNSEMKAAPWTEIPTNSDMITLTAQKFAYRFRLYTSKTLQKGDRIKTLRVNTEASHSGSRYIDVTMEFYGSNNRDPLQRIKLAPNEAIYINVAGNDSSGFKVVKVLAPVPSGYGKEISDFAFETQGGGYLAIKDYRVIINHFSGRMNIGEGIKQSRAVEVDIKDGNYKILLDNGRVYSRHGNCGSLVPDLDYANI